MWAQLRFALPMTMIKLFHVNIIVVINFVFSKDKIL